MIELTVKGKKYKHPSKVEEITLQHWVDITSSEDEIEAFAAFAGIDYDELLTIPEALVTDHITSVTNLLTIDPETIKAKEIDKFKIGKETFYVKKDFDKVDMGSYLGATDLMSKMRYEAFHAYMLAIYCLKKNEKPFEDAEALHARAETMMKLDVITALNINGFFLNLSKAYQRDSLAYMEGKPPAKRSKQTLWNLVRSTVATKLS